MTKEEEFEIISRQLDTDFPEAWSRLEKMADENYEKAMELVADCYYRGKYVEMDEPLAFNLFRRIVSIYKDNGDTYRKLGDCCNNGYGVPIDYGEALRYYKIAWEKGIYSVGTDIGWIYAFSGYQTDEREAAKWFQRAAGKGVSQGKYFLGYFYDEGYGGLPVNKKLAFKYLSEAASEDNYSAIRYLFQNRGFEAEDSYWASITEKMCSMAEEGNANAQYDLAISYFLGLGIEKNMNEYVKLIQLAAAQRHLGAMLELGKGSLDYDSGFPFDSNKGYELLLECAKAGNQDAMYELYKYYKYSYSNEPDKEKKIFYWASKADENGITYVVQEEIAECCYEGRGTNKDLIKAAKYYEKVLESNETLAYRIYPRLCECHLLGTHDYSRAQVCIQRGREVINERMRENPTLYRNEMASLEYWIAYAYDNGLGVQRNLELAYRHFVKSEELGNEKAKLEVPRYKKGLLRWKKI